jgi:hypothetical protein
MKAGGDVGSEFLVVFKTIKSIQKNRSTVSQLTLEQCG